MYLQMEMASFLKTFRRLIHPNFSSLRMRQMKTSYTNTISVMDVETNRFGAPDSSAQHAKMLIFVKHVSIRDYKDLI
jgi:hypothetical protein